MSYCVNCGVELDASLEACPLCNTPVVNPKDFAPQKPFPSFPREKGQVEEVKRKDLGILVSVMLIAISVTCGLLNLLVFDASPWSLLVIGVCLILWVLSIPAVIYTKLNPYAALLLDGLSVDFYLYMITFMTDSQDWYWKLALPVAVFVTVLLELFVLAIRKLPRSILTTTLIFFVEAATLCVGLELLIEGFLGTRLRLTWSAVVLTVCLILIVLLVTLLSRKRLRNAVRRRLHF